MTFRKVGHDEPAISALGFLAAVMGSRGNENGGL
jgi:hypothetical protein